MLALVAAHVGAITSGADCTPSGTTLNMKWNSYSSEWGAYEIEGCTGVNPKLMLAAGATYTFDQSDATNWYHPVGFAYIAGGAHTQCPADSGNECPEVGGASEASGVAGAAAGGCGGGCIGGIVGGTFVPFLMFVLWMSNVFAKQGCPSPFAKKAPPADAGGVEIKSGV